MRDLCLYARRSLAARTGECVVRDLLSTVPPLWRAAECECAPCRERRRIGIRARIRAWWSRGEGKVLSLRGGSGLESATRAADS